jgi:hypothetical protein
MVALIACQISQSVSKIDLSLYELRMTDDLELFAYLVVTNLRMGTELATGNRELGPDKIMLTSYRLVCPFSSSCVGSRWPPSQFFWRIAPAHCC